MQKRLLVAVIVISISSLVVAAQVEQPKPMPGTYVHDFAGVISEDKKAEIQGKAQQLKDDYKTEIALVTIDSLQGEDSFDYSMRMSRSWGIGSPDNEIRGLLILVAVKDRKTSFRTSRHIEGEIPDAVTNDVSQTMNLYFKRGDFGGGLSAGLDKILVSLQSVYEPSAATPEKQSSGWIRFWIILWAGVAVLIAIEAVRKRRRERKRQEAAARQQKRRPATHSRAVKSKKAKSSSRSTESSTLSSSYNSGHSSTWGSSSSYDSGSSSSSDSGSSYSGGSDFGGGGSDSSW